MNIRFKKNRVGNKKLNVKNLDNRIYRIVIEAKEKNTIITLTDEKNRVIKWVSGGRYNISGKKRGNAHTGQNLAKEIALKALSCGIKYVNIIIRGTGRGRYGILKLIERQGLDIISTEYDPKIKYNGCKPPKARRL